VLVKLVALSPPRGVVIVSTVAGAQWRKGLFVCPTNKNPGRFSFTSLLKTNVCDVLSFCVVALILSSASTETIASGDFFYDGDVAEVSCVNMGLDAAHF
jgi:hypothetical protein